MTEIQLKAPEITNLTVLKLSANYIHLRWDDVGTNFYYFIEYSEDGVYWQTMTRTKETSIFYDKLTKETVYKFRVSVNGKGFTQSSWVYSDDITTFKQNLYTITKMPQLHLSERYINERFLENNDYINFNKDYLLASLMSSDFTFLDQYYDVDQVRNHILTDQSYHEIQGEIKKLCSDQERVMITQFKDVLYAYERFQSVIKVSIDKGQTWYYYKAFNDRVGNPVSKTIAYQNRTSSYILGYTKLFLGKPQTEGIRFSSDIVTFSSNDITFTRPAKDDRVIPFDVEAFSTFATLPADVSKYAEAIAASDEYCYIAARGRVRYINLQNTPVETDEGSPIFGENKFNDEILYLPSNNVVVKKMDYVDNTLFVLITGEVPEYTVDVHGDIEDSVYKGVYKLVGSEFIRVYGNTEKERDLISHRYSNMSTDGTKLFLGTSDFNTDNREVGLTSSKNIHYAMLVTDSVSLYQNWEYSTQEYYNEFNFSYFHRDKTRTWINNDSRAVVVYPDVIYTKSVDELGPTSPNRVLKETFNDGIGMFYSPNIEFDNFNKYASGVLLHTSDGRIFGYYEFTYRVRDQVKLHWKPNLVVLQTELTHQIHSVPFKPKTQRGLKDPNLVPLLHTMNPSSYVKEDTEFTLFIQRYLEYISEGSNSSYIKLLNLIKNKHAREPDSFEYLWSELYKRNVYLDKEKKDQVIRFFETRKSDFYSMKGTEASYKFLFKLLYNEDVEIDIESKNSNEYDIIIQSDNISEDIVGTTIYTKTGKSNVTYIDREYQDGVLTWRVTIHNLLGRFIEGQVLSSDSINFNGIIKVGVRGKDLLTNNIDYIDRGRSSYIMRIKSKIPATRYRDDVLRFVHPAGFGFIGVTLLTLLINSGLNMKHSETIIRKLRSYKFDSGYPVMWPDRVLVMRPDGTIETDPVTGEVMYKDHPRKGELFLIPSDEMITGDINTVLEYNFNVPLNISVDSKFITISIDQLNNTFNMYILVDYDEVEGTQIIQHESSEYLINTISEFTHNPVKNWLLTRRVSINDPMYKVFTYVKENKRSISDLAPSDTTRRGRHSPLFDASGTAWSMFRELLDNNLKDDIGNPRDPIPTQEKIKETS